ncbi:MAG TPA: polysaccharide biosynthesis/export family protein [Gemmata sp.]|jgi:polysaccharide export outer membrane protein|nr:polysaccharide biosynthesis/export family protein [Gemmata sp.]
MQGVRRLNPLLVGLLPLMLFGGVGCAHYDQFTSPEARAEIAVPPPGAVPTELDLITLPPYVIGAPDELLIEVVQQSTVTEQEKKDSPAITRTETIRLPVQPITGRFMVRPDGTVGLGYWGSVPISGLTLEQAQDVIRKQVAQNEAMKRLGADPKSLVVIVDVVAYNSKRYYVIFDGGGFGEQVYPFPVTGSECVLDALSNVYGLNDVASKRNIWVARRTPHPGQPWQILPVDWVGITQHGITVTNYQILPGDRIYVKAQKLVAIDRALSRIIAPIERLAGITLLGTNVYNQISGRGLSSNAP